MATSVFIVLEGVPYRTKSDACRAYGISVNAVNRRLKRGMSLEDAITTPLTKTWGTSCSKLELKRSHTSSIVCYGEEYDSIISFGRAFGIPKSRLYDLLLAGESPESIVERYSVRSADGRMLRYGNTIVSNGVHYRSVADFCRHLGVARNWVECLLKSGITPDEIENSYCLKTMYGVRRVGKVVVFDGKEYPSKSVACHALGVSRSVVDSKMKSGMTFEEAVNSIKSCIRYSEDVETHKLLCNGKYCLLKCSVCGNSVLLKTEDASLFKHSDMCTKFEWAGSIVCDRVR